MAEFVHNKCRDNPQGSFVANLYHFIACKLLLRVREMVKTEFQSDAAALMMDGMNVADGRLHGNAALLDRAHAVCEDVCPGMNMIWAWKPIEPHVDGHATCLPYASRYM